MEILINIPDEEYDVVQNEKYHYIISHYIWEAVKNGVVLPKGHGRLIDKDHMIARLETASKFYGGENADAFDERFSHGLKEAAIKVAEEPTIIEADKAEGANE